MSTPTSGDLLLVNRGGVNYQIDYDDMSTLQDTDLLLVNRAGVNYQIAASDINLGPDGVILPDVNVLTPVNGAGLNEGASYTPLSSAYVSTDSTPIYYRYFPETITTVSGTWTDENNLFNGQIGSYASIAGGSGTPQFVYTNLAAHGLSGECVVTAYCGSSGGTIEVIDENDQVLRTYDLPFSSGDANTAVGIVRADNKIRVTGAGNGTTVYISIVVIGDSNQNKYDYVITGRVALQFTDDTDLDKMVAPIIMTDENGNVKVPTTSTVDSTTTIPGVNKALQFEWQGLNNIVTLSADDGPASHLAPVGPRMAFGKVDGTASGWMADNVVSYGEFYLTAEPAHQQTGSAPDLAENSSTYNPGNTYINVNGSTNFIAEIGVAPKVLDIVTWTGTNLNRAIPHNLGTKPGFIIIKPRAYGNWIVWHKDLQSKHYLYLDEQYSDQNGGGSYFFSEPTQDNIYIGYGGGVNNPGTEYVAYIFAQDTPGKIKCGTYTGTNTNQRIEVFPDNEEIGVLFSKRKNANEFWSCQTTQLSGDGKIWRVNDPMPPTTSPLRIDTYDGDIYFNTSGGSDGNVPGAEYYYVAIAKDLQGPNSTQLNLLSGQDLEYFTTGTEITSNLAASGSNISFASDILHGNNNPNQSVNPNVNGQFFFDINASAGNKWAAWIKNYTNSYGWRVYDSERNFKEYLRFNDNGGESFDGDGITGPNGTAGYLLGLANDLRGDGMSTISYNFKAAREFFDVQKYVGRADLSSSDPLIVNHDLGVEPGCIIIKRLNNNEDWWVWHKDSHNTIPNQHYLYFNDTMRPAYKGSTWITPSADDFRFTNSDNGYSSVNKDYISYIFAADTPYVKCGLYTGNGTTNEVDCGFKARWIMIKDISSHSYDWVILDKHLGNKMMRPNTYAYQEPLQFDFTANGVTLYGGQNSAWTNNDGSQYIYVAIADETEGHPPNAPSSSTVTATPDPNSATMVVNAESFDVGDTASAPALNASITSVAESDGNSLLVDGTTGTWLPGLYAKGSETTVSAPSAADITFTSTNAGTTPFSGVDAALSSRTWTLESGTTATGPWTVVDTYVDYDALETQDGATPWSTNKPNLAADTFYRVKVQYDSTNAESVESVYSTFKTSA